MMAFGDTERYTMTLLLVFDFVSIGGRRGVGGLLIFEKHICIPHSNQSALSFWVGSSSTWILQQFLAKIWTRRLFSWPISMLCFGSLEFSSPRLLNTYQGSHVFPYRLAWSPKTFPLLRWRHNSLGLVSFCTFVTIQMPFPNPWYGSVSHWTLLSHHPHIPLYFFLSEAQIPCPLSIDMLPRHSLTQMALPYNSNLSIQ